MSSVVQEAEHAQIVERRAVQDAQTPEGLKTNQMVLEDAQLPLEQKKRKILRNLRTLEQAGSIAEGNKYQDLINEISKVKKGGGGGGGGRACSSGGSAGWMGG